MDHTIVDELAKKTNDVEFLSVGQDLFDRTKDEKKISTKASNQKVTSFLTMLTKKSFMRIWVYNGTEFAGVIEKIRKIQGIQLYSAISEIKPAFAKITIRSKSFFYCDIEDYP